MRTLVGVVGSIVTICALAGCGASTTPTAPTAAPVSPNGFGVIMESSASAGSSFSACLSGSAAASCFSAPRIHAGNVTAAAATAPSAPMNLVVSSSGNSVTLTWSVPGGGDAVTTYIIEAGSGAGLANLANFATGNTLTMFQASGIGAGTYYVRLRAANSAGTSAPSNEAILVVGGSPGSAPGAPSGLTNTVNAAGTVSFTWNAASGSPTSYIIEAGSQPGLANLASSDLGSAATTMTATGVGAGTYYVRVRAKNAFGISSPSNEVVLTVGTVPLGCNPVLGTFVRDFFGVFNSTVPVGRSSGLTVTFSFRESSYSEAAFEGFYTDSVGRRGWAGLGYTKMQPAPLRMSFFFQPDFSNVVVDGAIFRGDPSVCSGNTVLAVTGEVHMGYEGSAACRPGETCDPPAGGLYHFTGPGFPMTLTRQ